MPTENGPALPDPDEFERELRNLTSGKAEPARFTELSAAERAKLAEQARQADRTAKAGSSRMSWRSARKARKLRGPLPEPGRSSTGQAARRRRGPAEPGRFRQQPAGQRPGARNRSALRTIAVIAAFVLLLYGLHLLGLGPPLPSGGGSGGQASPTASPSASQAHRSSSPPASTPTLSAIAPFAGSPAEQFGNDAAAILRPVAHPVAGYTATQVRAAYLQAKRLLVAAYLDPTTLAGGFPAAFARLLSAAQHASFVHGLGQLGVSKDGLTRSTRSWVASFPAQSTILVGHVIKVHGYMAAMPATDGGRHVLRVHVDYVFVYPVQRPGLPATLIRIVVQALGNADFARWTSHGGSLQLWWFPLSSGIAAGGRCDAHDGFIHPNFPGSPPDLVRPTGKPIDPYKLNPPSHAACPVITRT